VVEVQILQYMAPRCNTCAKEYKEIWKIEENMLYCAREGTTHDKD
jgi:hypothetical protein